MSDSRRVRQAGQIMVVMAFLMVVLLGLAAIAIDSGVAQADRRDLQTYADSAALAGAAQYNSGGTATDAHYIAILYIQKSLHAGSAPAGCTSGSCPAGSYTFSGGYTITIQDPSAKSLDIGIQHSQRSFFASMVGFNTDVAASSGRAEPTTSGYTPSGYAVAAVGNPSQDVHINGGGVGSNPSGDVNGPVYATGSYGANNAPHTTQASSYISGYGGTGGGAGASTCDNPAVANHVDLGGLSNGLHSSFTGAAGTIDYSVAVPPADVAFQGEEPTATGPTFTTTAAAKDGSGHWNPGTYNGIAPSGGLLNPGVFLIKNYSGTFTPGANVTNPGTGQSDSAGAVSLVLDASDTGTLDLNSAQLNGIDDLNPQGFAGARDPLGTHNFVIWGGTFAGSIAAFQPHDTAAITGIMFLPNQSITEHGVASPVFAGSVWVNSVTIDGGGNGVQVFAWVCGLAAVNAAPSGGGLVR